MIDTNSLDMDAQFLQNKDKLIRITQFSLNQVNHPLIIKLEEPINPIQARLKLLILPFLIIILNQLSLTPKIQYLLKKIMLLNKLKGKIRIELRKIQTLLLKSVKLMRNK